MKRALPKELDISSHCQQNTVCARVCVACDFSHGQGYRNLDMINESLIDKLPVKIVLAPHDLFRVQTAERSGIEGWGG